MFPQSLLLSHLIAFVSVPPGHENIQVHCVKGALHLSDQQYIVILEISESHSHLFGSNFIFIKYCRITTEQEGNVQNSK